MQRSEPYILSDSENQAVYKFIRRNGVEHDDVVIEIQDHYATAIEHKLTEHPNIKFESALNSIHRELGGRAYIKEVEKTKKKAIESYWARRTAKYLSTYFTSSKIFIFIPIGLFIYSWWLVLRHFLDTSIVFASLLIFSMILYALVHARNFRVDISAYPARKLFIYRTMHKPGSILGDWLETVCIGYIIFNSTVWENTYLILLCAVANILVIIFMFLRIHAFETEFKYWIKEELETNFPEYAFLLKF